jgi:hypothetical protein
MCNSEKITDYELAPSKKSDQLQEHLGKEPRRIIITFFKIPLSIKEIRKNIKGGLMRFRKFLGFSLVLVLLFSFACAGKNQDATLKAYASSGILLETIHKTAKASCDAKYIPGKECNKMVALYTKTKAAYYEVGETSILVAQAADTLQKQIEACKLDNTAKCDITNFNLIYQSALQLYQKNYANAAKLFNELTGLVSQFGVGGVK